MSTKPEDAAAAAGTTPVETPQSYEDAFAEATQDETTGATKPAAGDQGATAPAEGIDAAGAGTPAEGAAAAGDGAAEPDAAAAAAAAPAATQEADPAVALAAARARIAELEAAAAAAVKPPAAATPEATPAATPEATAAAAEAPIEWYQPSEEEAALIAQHEKDWPDIAAAQAIATKRAVYNAVQYVFKQIQKQYDPVLDRFGTVAEAIEDQLVLTDLRRAHADYDSVRGKVETWVDTLPGYQKNGAKAVLKEGTPEEVAELISEYKKANPAAAGGAPAAAAATPAAPASKHTELTGAAKKAAAKLTVVDSKRTSQAVAPDMNDFDAAWNEANAG